MEALMQKAAWVHVRLKDSHSLLMTMKLVGFTDEEASNQSPQQHVRRLSSKCKPAAPSAIKCLNRHQQSELLSPANLRLSSVSGSGKSTMSSLMWNTLPPRSSPTMDLSLSVNLEAKLAAVATNDEEFSTSTGNDTTSGATEKKAHCTPHQVQEHNASWKCMK